jgi:hypothetical protein
MVRETQAFELRPLLWIVKNGLEFDAFSLGRLGAYGWLTVR